MTLSEPHPTMHVYNTLSKKKEPFRTVQEGKVGIYLCGPTVYDKAHIGHMVGPVIFDCIKRYLVYCGYDVCWVVNITDVDDKLINKANERGISMLEVAEENIADYDGNLAALGVDQVDHFPRATDCMDDIVRFIEADRPLPEKYRFLLFEDKREVELVWNGKTSEVCNIVLPFQVIEQVDEPRAEEPEDAKGEDKDQGLLFSLDERGRQLKGWTNKLIWGDNKLVLSSLKNGPMREEIESQGGIKLIYIDPPFDVGADFSMDVGIGGDKTTPHFGASDIWILKLFPEGTGCETVAW